MRNISNKLHSNFFCFTCDKNMALGKVPFLLTLFLENEEQPSEKMSEQCSSGKMNPTCQNLAIFEHFQNWLKNQGDGLLFTLMIYNLQTLKCLLLLIFSGTLHL